MSCRQGWLPFRMPLNSILYDLTEKASLVRWRWQVCVLFYEVMLTLPPSSAKRCIAEMKNFFHQGGKIWKWLQC